MKKFLIACAAVLAAQSTFAANEMMLTEAKAKSGLVASLDLVSDGTATMLQARIDVGNVDASQVDLSGCVSALPKTHAGECHFAKGQIIVIVTNDSGVGLSAGVVNIGKIMIRSTGVSPKITEFLAADRNNAPVHGSVRVNSATK